MARVTTLRVATYNLYVGADLTVLFDAEPGADLRDRTIRVLEQLRATDVASRLTAAARILARERPDVVGLQEVATWTIRPGDRAGSEESVDGLDLLLAELDRAGTPYRPAVVNPTMRGGAEVDGLSTRVQGHDVVLVRERDGLGATDTGTGLFTTSMQLPTPPGLRMEPRRGWCRVDLRVDGVPVRFASVHLEAWDAAVRRAQLAEVVAALGRDETARVLVGDFNAEVGGVAPTEGYDDAWRVGGVDRGPGYTGVQRPGLDNETSALRQRIDGVLVRGAGVRDVRVVGDQPKDRTPAGLWPSDHAAVVADLRLGA